MLAAAEAPTRALCDREERFDMLRRYSENRRTRTGASFLVLFQNAPHVDRPNNER